ncbi:MAG: adenine phosphoribosyltransferase [SAR202 cluster bacterium]|nr:adenine phosphoribosyltransferase [SAR202 cluster bacterium]
MAIDLARYVRDIPDFPQPGILFRDITPLLSEGKAFRAAVDAMAEPFRDAGVDRVAAIEARGYMLGAPVAALLGVGFVPVRKVGKLPFHTYRAEYALEYGKAAIEMHRDALLRGHRVLLIDDVLATGGTLAAAMDLVRQSGAEVAGVSVLIELAALDGRARLGGAPLHTVIRY